MATCLLMEVVIFLRGNHGKTCSKDRWGWKGIRSIHEGQEKKKDFYFFLFFKEMRNLGCVWWTRMREGGWKVWEKNQENELEREEEGILFLGKWEFWVVYGEWECESVRG